MYFTDYATQNNKEITHEQHMKSGSFLGSVPVSISHFFSLHLTYAKVNHVPFTLLHVSFAWNWKCLSQIFETLKILLWKHWNVTFLKKDDCLQRLLIFFQSFKTFFTIYQTFKHRVSTFIFQSQMLASSSSHSPSWKLKCKDGSAQVRAQTHRPGVCTNFQKFVKIMPKKYILLQFWKYLELIHHNIRK